MNKLIQELAYNAAKATNTNLMAVSPEFVAEFAELIVRQSAGIANGSDMPGRDIKDYFGFFEDDDQPGWGASIHPHIITMLAGLSDARKG